MLLHRRELLATAAWFIAVARASVITGHLPWYPEAGNPAHPGPWHFFTADEAAAVEALVVQLRLSPVHIGA